MDNWYESVTNDLHKACNALKYAHAAEAEATRAVFLAEIDNDHGTVCASSTGRFLKEIHTKAIREVNETEARVRDVFEDEKVFIPVYEETMTAYAAKLKERSETLYECHTQTLVLRHLMDTRAKKLCICKRHLVSMVENRTHAELEVTRISKLYTDGLADEDNLLAQQLELVRIGTRGEKQEHRSFMKDFASQHKLFCTEAKEVVHEAVCELVDRVLEGAKEPLEGA
tara:strand:+ start:2345 stop:3025 length:681 start_codon:yes stop_codon:yes gene_type:complete